MNRNVLTGETIRKVRKKLKMTQTELAAALGLSNPDKAGRITISRYENGKVKPPSFLKGALDNLEEKHKEQK